MNEKHSKVFVARRNMLRAGTLTLPWAVVCLVVALLLVANPALQAYAYAGDLDPTFSGNGKVITDFDGGVDVANAVAIHTNGKAVAVGSTSGDFALARYDTDGSLDTSFSGNGKVITGFGPATNDVANAVDIQSNGKIVAAGVATFGSSSDFALARYHNDGSLDTSFGSDGRVTTSVDGSDGAEAVVIQTNGKIVVAGHSGYCDFTCTQYFVLARYNTDGSLDNTFGGDGLVENPVDGSVSIPYALALQSDGRIVAAGFSSSSIGFEKGFALARYNTDGSLDTSFGGDGKVSTDFVNGEAEVHDVAIQGNGKIVAVGHYQDYDDFNVDFALARYNINGTLDNTFSDDGKIIAGFGGFDYGQSLAIQPNGKILAAGYKYTDTTDYDFALGRFNSDGTFDSTFNGDGRVFTDFNNGSEDVAHGMALQSDGHIVLAGGSVDNFALARYEGGDEVPPTETPTGTVTRTPTQTSTSVPATATRTNTVAPTSTATRTSTNTPTSTAQSTATATATSTQTNTPVPTATATRTNTVAPTSPANTATPTPTAMATPIATATATATPNCSLNSNYLLTTATGATQVPATNYVPGSTCDACTVNITLPFAYSLYDTPYTSVIASNKGNLQFSTNNSTGVNACLPAAALGDSIVAYWDDINTNINDSMGIFTSVSGVAPNRIFNIRWSGGFVANDARVNFEVRLYEGQPKYEVIYAQTRGGFSTTVGVQKGDGARFTQYSCNTNGTIQAGMRLTFDRNQCSGLMAGKP